MTGKRLRLSRIFRGGKAVIGALDYASYAGPVPGLERPRSIVQSLVDAGVDAILVNPGFAREVWDLVAGRAGMVVRLTGGSTRFCPGFQYHPLIAGVRDAVRLGADAVAVMVFVGGAGERLMWENLGNAISDAEEYGLPVIAEVIPEDPANQHSVDWIATCARAGFELGADVIKTYYTDQGFDGIVKGCPAPIVIAGGPKNADALTMVGRALRDGSKGVAFGRNIFQAKDPFSMASQIVRIVHESSSPEGDA